MSKNSFPWALREGILSSISKFSEKFGENIFDGRHLGKDRVFLKSRWRPNT